jgi:FkbM family methyltransferase
MKIGGRGSDATISQVKSVVRHILAHPSVNPAVTAAIRPWAHSLMPSTLLRIPVKRIVEVQSPYCDGPILLDTAGVDPIASMLYWWGLTGWEPETLPVFLRLIQPGMTVLDVGANTGLFSLLAARRSPTVAVHAVEPVPRVFDMLQANVARNHLANLSCHRLALSDREGSVAMYVPKEEIPVMASLLPQWRPGSDRIDVEAQTLDRFAADLGIRHVDVLKVDTEGTEHDVLAGAAGILSADRPFVVCEVLTAGNTADALTAQLGAADYVFFLLTKEGPRPAERILGNATGGCHNYLFVPRSRLEEARLCLAL